MTTLRTIVILVVCLGFTSAPAVATVYEFWNEAEGNSWHTPGNWRPEGPPFLGHTAIILSGEDCYIEDTLAFVTNFEVQDGATLTIRNEQHLYVGSMAADTESTINGELRFEGTSSKLIIAQGSGEEPVKVTITSTDANGGLIVANGTAGHRGRIDRRRG